MDAVLNIGNHSSIRHMFLVSGIIDSQRKQLAARLQYRYLIVYCL